MIALIDTGTANLTSVSSALQRVGASVQTTLSPDALASATGIVLPGVGAFSEGMARLHKAGVTDPLLELVRDVKTPLLGICLGMQLLGSSGLEGGDCDGLGLIPGAVERLAPTGQGYRVPNMGWCGVSPVEGSSLVMEDSFYFAHSYHLACESERDIAGTIPYGDAEIVVAVERGNVFGVQFHPEKSQDAGLAVLDAFVQHAETHGRAG